jgi:hypothetical protein
LFLLGTTTAIQAQKPELEKKLNELGISGGLAFNDLSGNNSAFSCMATMTETTSDKTTVQKASFDPRKPESSRWTLLSVDGRPPSKKELKHFNKEHNAPQDDLKAEPDENNWKIVSEDEHLLVIGLKYNEADLPHQYKFLADCNAEIYVDKEARRLYKVKFYNTTPLKIKIFNVVKLDMTVELMPSKDGNTILTKDQTIVMDVKMLGELVEIIEETAFYDYERVR